MLDISASQEWRKSSFCADGACVEVAQFEGDILMRDGKNTNLPALRFPEAEWRVFVDGVTAGDFSFN
jgi:hypothetical protein